MAKLAILSQLFVIALLVAACAGSASAAPVTYVFTGIASGNLGDFSFTNATLTVTATGDTNNVTCVGDGSTTCTNATLSTTITINPPVGGFGTLTVTPSEGNHDYVFDNQTPFPTPDVGRIGYGITGLGEGSCCDIIQFPNAAYLSYDLKSSIGAFAPTTDLSTADWVNVPTSVGPLTVSSYTGTFSATEGGVASITQTLQPGVQAVYSFDGGANKYKITPSPFSTGGEVLTITEVPNLKSNFSPPANFPNETCIPVANFTAQNGADTCVNYQADCSFGGVPNGGDCTTLLYTLLESYDLPPDLPAIGGPDFLVVHGSGCPTSSTALAQSIFTDYFVNRIDPTTKGGGGGTGSCFEVTYTPGAPLITSGSTSSFVGFEFPVSDTRLNPVYIPLPVLLSWDYRNSSSGKPVTNLHLCNNTKGLGCTAPWVNLGAIPITCPAGPATGPEVPISSLFNTGLLNFGGGEYSFVWNTAKGFTKGSCAVVVLTFDSGLTEFPATFQFH